MSVHVHVHVHVVRGVLGVRCSYNQERGFRDDAKPQPSARFGFYIHAYHDAPAVIHTVERECRDVHARTCVLAYVQSTKLLGVRGGVARVNLLLPRLYFS